MIRYWLKRNSNYRIILFALTTSIVISCNNKIYVSEYSDYNSVDKNYLQTFDNDSLKFSIDLWGRNDLQQFGAQKKYTIPKYCTGILKTMGIRKKAKLLLYLKPGIQLQLMV
ncbi:hypothetical protein [Segetibacter koreensis]|uniref:hypothetical protein n=1 Tax=Segetibacter koreensis TaxID=398037 RepID=UPI00036C4015|nr:hypothetical protein [Segetibacter koreensis]